MSDPAPTFGRRSWWVFLLAAAVTLSAGSAVLWYKLARDPNVAWLSPEQNAEWIRYDEAATFEAREAAVVSYEFRTIVERGPTDAPAVLTLRAFRSAAVYWDGRLIHPPRSREQWSQWKTAQDVQIPADTGDGPRELRIQVFNDVGPPLVLAHCELLGVQTGADWEARKADGDWTAVTTVNEPDPPELSRQFPAVRDAVRNRLPLLLGICAMIGALSFIVDRRETVLGTWGRAASAGTLRWILWGAWVVLAFNNQWKLAIDTGFDVGNHWEYIEYLIAHKRVPLANEGWQMFQSPLYYMLTAALYSALSVVVSSDTAVWLTRFIPLACGAIQVELCYRGMRYAYPDRNDLQSLGLLLGGLLPMNLYISQGFGNEPLQAVFSSAAVVMAFRFLRDPHDARSPTLQLLLGVWLGLGLLTKVSVLLLVPPCCGVLAYVIHRDGSGIGSSIAGIARVLTACALVAGWYYVRNWIYLGQPFVGGWDAARGIAWWQYPGYRTLSQFTTFGECLEYPICVSYWSIWDGLYSSFWLDGTISSALVPEGCQWNDEFMLAGAWLGLLPTATMLLGAYSAIRIASAPIRDCLLFSIACLGIYFAALLYMNLNIPFCSHAKSTVTLGLIPCYAALGAAGFDLLTRHSVVARVACWSLFGASAVFAYLAYFVVS